MMKAVAHALLLEQIPRDVLRWFHLFRVLILVFRFILVREYVCFACVDVCASFFLVPLEVRKGQ